LENARMEWKTSKKTYDTFSQSISMEHLWFPYHSIHWRIQEWNGKQVKKHLILSLTIYPNGRLWFPYHSIDWTMQEWNGSMWIRGWEKTYHRPQIS
jgi:hypothetical protein